MYFTLAVSAADPDTCQAVTRRACGADPRALPIPGPARVEWRSRDGRAALVTWGAADGEGPGPERRPPPASHAGTIWVSDEGPGAVSARTGITRVDPVYLVRVGGAAIVSDRATWAAATAGRLGDADPILYGALLSLGYPLGAVTPFTGVRALGPGTSFRAAAGTITEGQRDGRPETGPGGAPGAARLADALVQAVGPLRAQPEPVELSLTGGKDSRLIAAALASAGVPARARTYGFPGHPDVVVAALVARELGLEHTAAQPRTSSAGDSAPASGPAVQEVDVLGRLRATVLVADGMLSSFENVGRPDPAAEAGGPAVIGGHGGELLRGGYAKIIPGSAARRTAGSAELLRRLAMRRLPLLRARWRTAYLAGLAPWLGAVTTRPQAALDDFYLVNRAGRWSAAARQAYSIRSAMIQPFFDDQVVRAARSVPLAERLDERLVHGAIGALCPPLLDIPLAADRWKCDPKPPPVTAPPGQQRARFDWRRDYGDEVAAFLRDYVLDVGSAGGLFTVVSRPAAERLLRPPHTDPVTVWALATLAALISQDWLNARSPSGRTFAIPVPA
jgi:hypothetical protein